LRNFGDRRECLTTKAKRTDAEQVVCRFDLAGRVAGDGQHELVFWDARSIIGEPDQFSAALF